MSSVAADKAFHYRASGNSISKNSHNGFLIDSISFEALNHFFLLSYDKSLIKFPSHKAHPMNILSHSSVVPILVMIYVSGCWMLRLMIDWFLIVKWLLNRNIVLAVTFSFEVLLFLCVARGELFCIFCRNFKFSVYTLT